MSALCQAVAIGASLDVTTGRTGRVHSVFDRAVNLLVDAQLWTIIAEMARVSPFTICLPPGSDARMGAAQDMPVHVRAGYVRFGNTVIDCRVARRWSVTAWPSVAEGLTARLALASARVRPAAWRGSGELAREVLDGLASCQARRLNEAVARSVGNGPGLTPSGDDVIIGILAALKMSPILKAGPDLARRLSHALTPHLGTTTDIGKHLLTQAMGGHFSRPLHELGLALHTPERDSDLPSAIDQALSVGATSGADTSIGLIGAMQYSYATLERSAA